MILVLVNQICDSTFVCLSKGGAITETVMGIRAERLDRTVEEEGVVGVAEAGVIGRIKIKIVVAPKSGVRRTEILVEDGAAAVAAALVGGVAGQEEMTVGMLVVQGGVMPRRAPMMAEEAGDAEKTSRRRRG